MSDHLWLRAETKPFEARTPLTPHATKAWLAAKPGRAVTVERSHTRCFADADYAHAGAQLADAGQWVQAPGDALILGLKELPAKPDKLQHSHAFFAHAFKEQTGWMQQLGRFEQGAGKLYDLEYLVDENGRRIAAFGHWAGYVGAGLGLQLWAHRQIHGFGAPAPAAQIFSDAPALQSQVQAALLEAQSKGQNTKPPQVVVIGAAGRSGKGAVALCEAVGANVVCWDLKETAKGGPFEELLDADVVINCVLVQQAMPPFLSDAFVAQAKEARRLNTIVDVSCDPTGPFNPLPFAQYRDATSFDAPAIEVASRLELIAIDNLPTAVPKESSEDFCAQLLPHLQNATQSHVWEMALKTFHDKLQQSRL